ncbi:MAG: SusD/RagB family nutrient-binding outer membrane lipoprotein, partial [Ferruginibacter sp.]
QVSLPFPSVTGGIHRYELSENIGNGAWNNSYKWLNNVKEMYAASIKAGDVNYQAIAMTMNAWIYGNLTDCFGDVPMDEASRADSGILKPKFNTQQQVYTKIIAGLDSANNMYNTSKAMAFGTDILFANNVSRWKKFTNSLRMRLLLRVYKKPEMNSLTQLNAMIADPTKYPVFTSNAEAGVLQLTGITPMVSPWGRAIDFTTFRASGKFFLDSLTAFNDPRLPKFATQAKNTGGPLYKGIPSGYAGSESQFNYTPSNLNIALVTAPMICIVMNYAEVEFIKAEVAWRNGDAAAAQSAYEKGVKAAIEQWGATMPATYFNNSSTAYDGTLEKIMLQKYYALYFIDYQQWFEYRRTGLPVLPVADGMINNKLMPARFRYPIPVRTNNPDNYKAAVESMGPDDINTKVWWQD